MTNTQQFYAYLLNHPGAAIEAMSNALDCSKDSCYQYVSRMQREGKLISSDTRPKQYHLKEKVALAEIQAPIEPKKAMPLRDCLNMATPRELLEELKRRGYVWDKMWVEERKYIEYEKI